MKQPSPVKPLFDVIATHVPTGSTKIVAADKTEARAQAFLELALTRRKAGDVVYQVVPAATVDTGGGFPWRSSWSIRRRPEAVSIVPYVQQLDPHEVVVLSDRLLLEASPCATGRLI